MKNIKEINSYFNIHNITSKKSTSQILEFLTIDSRECVKNSVFVAYKGDNFDGHDFILSAIKNGADVVIYENETSETTVQKHSNILFIKNKLSTEFISNFAKWFYADKKENEIPKIGVTGTNGKSSICHFFSQILNNQNQKSAIIGTLGNGFFGNLEKTNLTTPDACKIQYLLAKYEKLADACILEVSSHSLVKKRVADINFSVAIFTQLSEDHLDFHTSMENYFQAKLLLFKMKTIKKAIINIDCPYGLRIYEYIIKSCKNIDISLYSENKKNNNYKCKNYLQYLINDTISDSQNVTFIIDIENRVQQKYDKNINILGDYNIANITASVLLALDFNDDFYGIINKLNKLKAPKGRLEIISYKNKAKIIIDYAHTADALEKTLKAVAKTITNNTQKLWCIFGCGGDRYLTKRMEMGRIANDLSDFIILTSDNPRNENPDNIINDIEKGILNKSKVTKITNRKIAIEYALNNAKKDDVILLAGKGHETYIEIKNVRDEFDERNIISDFYKTLKP